MRPFAQPRAAIANWELQSADKIGLADVVRNIKPTVLVGVTAQPRLFNPEILKIIAGHEERPVIFALSNRNSKSECTPEDVFSATQGKGLLATGSPFPPVSRGNKKIEISQANNMFIFPGVGLGALVLKASKVTDRMFLAASRALSNLVSEDMQVQGQLLPEIKDIREVSFRVALAVAKEARDSGLGRLVSDEQLEGIIRKAQWEPHYYSFRPGLIGG